MFSSHRLLTAGLLCLVSLSVSANEPPDCGEASISPDSLWPPNHKLRQLQISGVHDPDGDPVTITTLCVMQDEPVNGAGDGNTEPDAFGLGTATPSVLSERSGPGDGRVYHVDFMAEDPTGAACIGTLEVGIPHNKKSTPVDGGRLYDSSPNNINCTGELPDTNTPPVARDQALATPEDTAMTFQPDVYDEDGDPLTFEVITEPGHGALSGSWPDLTYTPESNYHGQDSFSYRVNDGSVDSGEATVNITVTPVNDAPVIPDQSLSLDEDTTGTWSLNATDVDGDSLVYEIIAGTSHGDAGIAGDQLTYTPYANYNGTDQLEVSVTDPSGLTDSAVINLGILPINDPPAILTSGVTSAFQDSPYFYGPQASEPDGDPLTWELLQGPDGMVISPITGGIYWTPDVDDVGFHDVVIRVEDGTGLWDEQRYRITVDAYANRAPAITSVPGRAAYVTETYRYSPQAADPDNDPLTWELISGPEGLSVALMTGEVFWVPSADQLGSHTAMVRVSDIHGASAEQRWDIAVSADPENAPPVILSSPVESGQVGESYRYPVEAVDPDNDSLQYRLLEPPAGMTVSAAGIVGWVPDNEGNYAVTVKVIDGRGGEALQAYDLPVSSPYEPTPPNIVTDALTNTSEDQAYRYLPEVVDPDSEEIFSWEGAGSAAVNENTGESSLAKSIDNRIGLPFVNSFCLDKAPRLDTSVLPVVKWHWDGRDESLPHNATQVYGPVSVSPLTDDNGDGTVDKNDRARIIFSAGRHLYTGKTLVVAVDGETGETLWATPGTGISHRGSLSVGDINNDGLPEIVGVTGKRDEVVALDNQGGVLWRSPNPNTDDIFSSTAFSDGVNLSDLNGDGSTEIIAGGTVFDADGSPQWVMSMDKGAQNPKAGFLPVVADFDGDGFQEISAGRTLYSHDGTVIWHNETLPGDGTTAIANFDEDEQPEIVLVTQGRVYLVDDDGSVIWMASSFVGSRGGPPTVGDFDADGLPEIGVAYGGGYKVFESDGTQKWWAALADQSSGRTGSSLFDFDGDGTVEVVIADEKQLRIFSGGTGEKIFIIENSSVTSVEYPVIADLDNDNHAEIAVGSNWKSTIRGLRVFEAYRDDWLPTRSIWNQHAYNINNINDDLSVPARPERSWLSHNTFRLNTFPDQDPLGLPDLAVAAMVQQGDALAFTVINRGQAAADSANYRLLVDGQVVAEGDTPSLDKFERAEVVVSDISSALGSGAKVTVELFGTTDDCVTSNNTADAAIMGLTVTDKYGLSDNQRWLVTVQETNDVPVIIDDLPESISDGEEFTHTITVNDPDSGDDHRFRLASGPEGLSLERHGGELRWDVPPGLTGRFEAVIRAEDLSGETTELTWAFEVAPPNGNLAPEIISRPVFGGNTLESYRYDASVRDDGSVFTWQLLEAPAGMTVSNAGVVSWQPESAGNYPVTLEVTDEGGRTDTQEWVIIVVEGATENPPVFGTTPPAVVAAGSRFSYDMSVTDSDGDPVTLEALQVPQGMNLTVSGQQTALVNGTLDWSVPEALSGTVDIVLRATDDQGYIAEQRFSLEVLSAGSNQAPVINSSPAAYAYPDQQYRYALSAADPEGGALAFALESGPSGSSLGAGGVLTWTPDQGHTGSSHDFSILVTDGVGNRVTQSWRVHVVDSTAPQILSLPRTDVQVGDSYQYVVNALDPEGEELSHALTQAPVGMSVSGAGVVSWTPVESQAGVHEVTLTVTDSQGNVTPQQWNLEAYINKPPVISSEPITGVVQGYDYLYQLEATDDRGATLNYSLVQAPFGMSVDAAGAITWSPVFEDVGEHAVVVRVDDGRTYSDQHYTLVVDEVAPELTADIRIEPGYVRPGEDILVRVIGDGGVGTLSIRATLDGEPLTLTDGQATVSFSDTGRHTVSATVTDGTDTVTDEAIFAVGDDSDTDAPVVNLTSPTWNQEITAPISVTGTVDDANLAEYLVAWKRPGTDEQQIIARGTTPVTDAELATFDPSLMQNGLYQVIVQATDLNGQTNSTGMLVHVTGDLKVGNFSFTVEDLNIPMAGIPIRITRTYDTRQKHRELDFGHGWSIGYQDVKIDESGEPSKGWQQTTEQHLFTIEGQKTAFNATCTRSLSTREVAVTLPDGEVHRFTARAEAIGGGTRADSDPDCYLTASRYFNLRFEADEDTDSTLTADGVESLYLSSPGGGNLSADITSAAAVPVSHYTLTTREGYVYELDQAFGIDRVITPNGHTLDYTDHGIFHSAGKSVAFERGAGGRINAILDPSGNRYEYRRDSRGDLVAMTDPLGNESTYRYNRRHGLTDMRDALGRRIVRNIYDDSGRLIAQEDSDGNRTDFNHDLQGRQSIVTDRRGNATVLYYNDTGDVLSRVDALGNVTSFTYDGDRNQTSETNPEGETSTATYNGAGDQLTQTDPLGNTTSFTYNERGQELTITDARGNSYQNSYDSVGNLTAIQDPQGNTASNTVNAEGLVTASTDLAGETTTYAYDSAGNKVSETDPAGNVTSWTYDDNGNVLTESVTRTVNGQTVTETTTFEYDALNRVVATTDPLGNTTHTEYDPAGNEAATVDAQGRRTEYDYDAYSRLVGTHHPDGTSESREYDAEGNLVSETDRLGRTTTHTYDALNRRIRTTWPDGTYTETEYDKAGRVIAEVDERGHRTEYEYDAAGRRTAVIDALGNRHTFSYDADGNLVSETDANGHTTTYSYNTLGQKTKTIHADETETLQAHDPLSRKLSDTDQNSRTTQYAYDALGRLTKVTDAAGGETGYSYDSRGNKLTQTDAEGRTTTWTYDALGRVTSRTLPMGQTETFEYDAAGNVIRHVDFKGQVTTSQYDAMDRLIQRSYADGTVENWSYDAAGRKTGASRTKAGVTETTSYQYDARDRLIREEKPDGSVLTYDYDPAGNKISQTTALPDGNSRTTTYTYDRLNRLITANAPNGTTTYGYDAAGNRKTLTRPNGVTTTYTYDSVNRLTHQVTEDANGNVLSSYSYTLDPTGRRTRIDEADGRSSQYAYDSLYRLTSETITDPQNGDRTATYSYDAVGNRIEATVNGITTAYSYDDNDRLAQEGAASYSYDANGNTLQKTEGGIVISYDYDARNRLVEVTKPSGTLQYGYDADGIRTSKTEGGVTTNYVVDHNRQYAQVLAELENGALSKTYTYGDDLVSQQAVGGQDSFYLYDGLGTTRGLTDGSGALSDEYFYEAFGELLASSGSTENSYLFTGEQFDADLEQYYLRARYYDPSVGRFTQMDTWQGRLQEPVTLHKYLYAHADPVNGVDPSGKMTAAEFMKSSEGQAILFAAAITSAWYVSVNSGAGVGNPDTGLTATDIGLLTLAAMSQQGTIIYKLVNSKADGDDRNDEPVDYYRAVDTAEMVDIIDCNCFRFEDRFGYEPISYKRFWLEAESAKEFGRRFLKGDYEGARQSSFFVVRATVSKSFDDYVLSQPGGDNPGDRFLGLGRAVPRNLVPALNSEARKFGGIVEIGEY